MLHMHAGIVALGLLIGGFLGHLLYEVINPSPAVMTLAHAVPPDLPPGIARNANPHPDCRGATWPDIPRKCLTPAGSG